MKVAITGGGTGGHFFPALAVAKTLEQKGHSIAFFGSPNHLEQPHCEKNRIPFFGVSSKSTMKKDVEFVKQNLKGVMESIRFLRNEKPDVLYSTGGFTTFPVLTAAKLLRIPIILHEQNAKMGLVNRLFVKAATHSFHAFPSTIDRSNHASELVGNISRFSGSQNENASAVLFIGGSGGAKAINALAYTYAKENPSREVVLLSGQQEQGEKISNLTVVPFSENLDQFYALADVVITRCGSTTLTELSSFGLPTIGIPLPNSADNHQYLNAKFYADRDALVLIEENASTSRLVNETINHFSSERKQTLAHNIKRLAKSDTLEKVITKIEHYANR